MSVSIKIRTHQPHVRSVIGNFIWNWKTILIAKRKWIILEFRIERAKIKSYNCGRYFKISLVRIRIEKSTDYWIKYNNRVNKNVITISHSNIRLIQSSIWRDKIIERC